MVQVSIEILDAGEQVAKELRNALTSAGLEVNGASLAVLLAVNSLADCREAGTHISRFVGNYDPDAKIRMDGPGATTTIHRLADDEDMIAGNLATCAFLQ